LSPIPDEGWVTIREQDQEKHFQLWKTIDEISQGGRSLPSNGHPRVKEYDACMGSAVSMAGRLYECPRCGRLLWQRKRDEEYRCFIVEPDSGGK